MHTEQNESVTITLTPEEQSILLDALHALDMSSPSPLRALYLKFVFLFQKSGDLCRHLVQSPDVVGQDDTNPAQFDDDYVCDCDSPFCPNCQSPDVVG